MQISKKRFALALAVIAVLAGSFGYYINYATYGQSYQHQNPSAKDNVWVFIETVEGKYTLASGNVITNIGEQYTRGIHSTNQSTRPAVHWIAIGNATAGVALTELTTEYDRQLGTIANWTNAGDYAFNCTYTWTFTETVRLDCAGAHWDGTGDSDNNLYACANFDATTFNLNDNCTIRWSITFDAN